MLKGLLSPRHEHVEIPLDYFACGIVDVFAEIIIADSLAHTGEFLETVLATLCVYGQVYQFQGPENSPFDLVLVALGFPAVRTRNFAADVQHLERKRHFSPPARGKFLMLGVIYLHRE